MADLRETGEIEQDADIILFIYRPEEYGKEKESKGQFKDRVNTNVAEIIVSKNRNGPTGTVELTFLKHKAQFFTREQFLKEEPVYSQHYTNPEEPKTPPRQINFPPGGDDDIPF